MIKKHQEALMKARELCADNDARLLYLSVFGSALYGTSTGASDLDVRGIFLPSLQSIVLGKAKKSLHYSTGDNDSRNSAEDLDIDLWSLENWILHLLPEGDTGAQDLLFSPSNSACVIARSPLLDPVFANPVKFLDLAHNESCIRYCYSQAKKYGIKGSRLGALRKILTWLEENKPTGRLEEHLDNIMDFLAHDKYCFPKESGADRSLSLCGKIFLGRIKMEEFRERVLRDMNAYGSRARDAENNKGLDFKALSHALRALDQMEELLLTGKINFPLATRESLIRVKKGEVAWKELEDIIVTRIKEVEELLSRHAGDFPYERSYAENFLLQCYGLTSCKNS